ncbi:MAG: RDD family protein [Pseudomonadota bacterium]
MNTADLEYVGFWPRFGAQVIDSIIVTIITTLLLSLIPGPASTGDLEQMLDTDPADISLYSLLPGPMDLFVGVVLPGVAIVWLWRKREATPGKLAIGARVVDAQTGNAITLRQGIVRCLGYFVATLPLCLGLLWIAFDPRKQGWHDKLAGTVVVRAKKRGAQPVNFERG